MAESTQVHSKRDLVVTLAGGGAAATYSTSTGALAMGATEYTFVGEEGDVSLTFGGSPAVRVLDRGVLDQLRSGNEEPGQVTFTAQFRDLTNGATAVTLVGLLYSLRFGTANDKDASTPESTSVSSAGADDAETMSLALKLVWTNAGNSSDVSTLAVNRVTCSSLTINEGGDYTQVSATLDIHDSPANWYIG